MAKISREKLLGLSKKKWVEHWKKNPPPKGERGMKMTMEEYSKYLNKGVKKHSGWDSTNPLAGKRKTKTKKTAPKKKGK